ncbi:18228_t:CDS:2, partial [Acaulospora morrowiae]
MEEIIPILEQDINLLKYRNPMVIEDFLNPKDEVLVEKNLTEKEIVELICDSNELENEIEDDSSEIPLVPIEEVIESLNKGYNKDYLSPPDEEKMEEVVPSANEIYYYIENDNASSVMHNTNKQYSSRKVPARALKEQPGLARDKQGQKKIVKEKIEGMQAD